MLQKEAYQNIIDVLCIEKKIDDNMIESPIKSNILKSTENLPAQIELEPVAGSSKAKSPRILRSTQKSKITNFFKKENGVSNTENAKNVPAESPSANKRKNSFELEEPDKKIKSEVKIKTEDIKMEEDTKSSSKKDTIVQSKIKSERCNICKQYLDSNDLKIYNGHPNGAVEEFIALTDPKLMLFTGDETDIDDHDARPQNKVFKLFSVT